MLWSLSLSLFLKTTIICIGSGLRRLELNEEKNKGWMDGENGIFEKGENKKNSFQFWLHDLWSNKIK